MKLLIMLLSLLAVEQAVAKSVWQSSAVLVVREDKVTEFKAALSKIIVPSRKEKGCISYLAYQVLDERGEKTNKFELYEIWQSKETMLIDHLEKSPHMQKFFREIKAETPDSYIESFKANGKNIKIVDGV